MARGLSVGFVVTVLATFFADIQVQNMWITLSIAVLTSILFSLAGFINAVFAETFDDISIIPTFVLTPLIYLGGVFYSIDLLPTMWANLSQLNPILYMVNGFRYGILGVSDINVVWTFMMITVFVVIAFLYSLYLLNSGKKLRN